MALDVATCTGFAVGAPCTVPVYGSFTLDGTRPGVKFLQIARTVTDLIARHQATDIIVESVHAGGKMEVLLPLFGYRAAVLMAAERRLVPTRFVDPATWRKAYYGHGRLPRKEAKAAALEKGEWLGHHPQNDDEGDALGLWHFRCSALSATHLAMSMRRGAFEFAE